MGKKKWLLWTILPILAAAAVLVFLFWDAILLLIAPKYVLKNAAATLIAQVEERFSGDPLLILLEAVEPEGKYTADVDLDTSNSLFGNVHYDLKVQTDGMEHRIQALGTAATQDALLDMALYVAPEYMAVSSQQLVSETYYGLTFDTFKQDIRSIPLLDFFITEKMISQWDSELQSIRSQIARASVPIRLPQLSEEEIDALLLGLLALPCDVEDVSVSAENTFYNCRALSYQISAEQLHMILGDDLFSDGSVITMTFYLFEGSLVKMQMSAAGQQQGSVWEIYFGQDPLKEALSLRGRQNKGNTFIKTEITVSTQRTEDRYYEVWNFSRSGEEETDLNATYGFEYMPSSGMITLTNKNSQETANLILTKKEKGFLAESENFSQLLRVLNPEYPIAESVSGSVLVTQGSDIKPPEYKNLNDWSLEDFWTLLTGIGSLFGISIAS